MKSIKLFFKNVRQKLLARRIHREIANRIFPQLSGEKHCGYPFADSLEGLENLATFGALDAQLHLEIIESRAKQLPDTYRQAFRYIAYRDINARLKMYEQYARERTPCKSAQVKPQAQLAM